MHLHRFRQLHPTLTFSFPTGTLQGRISDSGIEKGLFIYALLPERPAIRVTITLYAKSRIRLIWFSHQL